MYCKLLCEKSVFANKHNDLSVKYDSCKRDHVMLLIFLEKKNLSTCQYQNLRLLLILWLNCVINTNDSILIIYEINHRIQTICLD